MTDRPNIFPPPPAALSIEPDLKVDFILSPRFTLLSFAGFVDCLRHAADESDYSRQIYCHWHVIAPRIEQIHSSCGVPVLPELTLTEAGEVDYLVVVGGQLPWTLDVPEETMNFLRKAQEHGTTIVGLCTGSFIIAHAGLLAGKNCAVNIRHLDQLKSLFPDTQPVTDRNFVIDDGVITCNGGTSPIDLACTLIETHSGKARAVKALNSLVVDHRRTEHHMPHRPLSHLSSCGNWRVEQATALMEQNLSNPFNVTSLAQCLNTSVRELHRAFKKHAHEPPSMIYRKMRLAHGHWLLNNTDRTITQIAFECGFSDGAHFSRWFKETYEEPPRLFRERRRGI